MASPFAAFRKYQGVLLAVFGVLIIVVFTIGDSLSRLTSGEGDQSDDVVVRWNGGSLTRSELSVQQSNRLTAHSLLVQLQSEAMNKRQAFPIYQQRVFGRRRYDPNYSEPRPRMIFTAGELSPQGTVRSITLAQRARELGMTISDKQVQKYVKSVVDEKIPWDAISKSLAGVEVTEGEEDSPPKRTVISVFNVLREEMLADKMVEEFFRGTYAAPGAQQLDYFARTNRQIDAELIAIPVSEFLDEVADPSESELTAYFEKYKSQPPMLDRIGGVTYESPDPGFKLPHRVSVEYVKVDVQRYVDDIRDTITDEEISEYYEKNKDRDIQMHAQDELTFPETDGAEGDGTSSEAGGDEAGGDEAGGDAAGGDAAGGDADGGDADGGDADGGDAAGGDAAGGDADGGDADGGDADGGGEAGGDADGGDADGGGTVAPSTGASSETGVPSTSGDGAGTPDAASDAADDAADAADGDAAEPENDEPGADASPEETDSSLIESVGRTYVVALQPGDGPAEPATEDAAPAAETDEATTDEATTDEATTDDANEAGENPTPASNNTSTAESGTGAAEPTEPASGGTADRSGDTADPSEPEGEEKKPNYKPLDEVKDYISRRIAEEKATALINEKFAAIRKRMNSFRKANRYLDEGEMPAIKRPDFKELATKNGLTGHSIILESSWNFSRETDIGKSFQLVQPTQFNPMGGETPFTQIVFEKGEQSLWIPVESMDDESFRYLSWKTDEKLEEVPELKGAVRDQVIRDWKLGAGLDDDTGKARALARQHAETLAGRVRDGKSIAEVGGEQPGSRIVDTGSFSWLTYGSAPMTNIFSRPTLQLSEVDGISQAGNDFMRAVFSLRVGGVAVAMNHPRTEAYVVKVTLQNKSPEVIQDEFLDKLDDRTVRLQINSAAEFDIQLLMRRWLEDIDRDMQLVWLRPEARFSR